MVIGKSSRKKIQSGILILLLFVITQCAPKSASELPKDILGISIGMSKNDAQKRLEEIALFERDEEKKQQIWRLKNDPRFSELAVGYDKENNLRYITLFVDKATAKERIRFTDVGDLSKSRKEIIEPHYRYIWEIAASEGKPAYYVNIYGDEPEFLTMFTLSEKVQPRKSEEEDE